MLNEAGLDWQKPNPELVWTVFKQFVQEPVECSNDGVLFECGVFGSTGQKRLSFDLTRQFCIDVDEEYHHMIQLRCTFWGVPATETTAALQTHLWAYDFETLADYFAAVEAMKEFQLAVMQKGWSFTLIQE